MLLVPPPPPQRQRTLDWIRNDLFRDSGVLPLENVRGAR